MNSRLSQRQRDLIYWVIALSLPLLVLALLFYFRPFWGLMDDSTNLTIVDDMKRDGILPVWWRLSVHDLFAHGRLRSIYFAMVAMIYVPAGSSSVIAFFINIAFLAGIFFFSAFAFWPSARNAFGLRSKHYFCFLFATLCFAYPWTIYAIRAPSVQEKIVLLFAALVLWMLYFAKDKTYLAWTMLVSFALLISLNTKETIALFFPLFLATQLFFDQEKKNYRRTITLLLVLIALAGLIKWAGTHGTYKAAYGLERALQTLTNSKSLYLFLILAFAASAVALLDFRQHRLLSRFALALSFPVGLILFLVLMIPWGLGGYLNCSATLFVVMCVIGIAKYLHETAFKRSQNARRAFAGLAYLAALMVLLVRLSVDYSTYADLRRILFSDELSNVAKENKTLWMPCSEGAGTVEHYLLRFRGLKLITRMPDTNPALASEPGQYWLTSPGNCSGAENSEDWIAQGKAESIVAPRFKGGYTLLRRIK